MGSGTGTRARWPAGGSCPQRVPAPSASVAASTPAPMRSRSPLANTSSRPAPSWLCRPVLSPPPRIAPVLFPEPFTPSVEGLFRQPLLLTELLHGLPAAPLLRDSFGPLASCLGLPSLAGTHHHHNASSTYFRKSGSRDAYLSCALPVVIGIVDVSVQVSSYTDGLAVVAAIPDQSERVRADHRNVTRGSRAESLPVGSWRFTGYLFGIPCRPLPPSSEDRGPRKSTRRLHNPPRRPAGFGVVPG